MCVINSPFQIKEENLIADLAMANLARANRLMDILTVMRDSVKMLRTEIKEIDQADARAQEVTEFLELQIRNGLENISRMKLQIMNVDPSFDIQEDPEVGEDGGELAEEGDMDN